jgi:hypothetical protein
MEGTRNTMILAQVRDEMNQVNWVLDEMDSIQSRLRNRNRKTELLHRAAFASIRGIEALREDARTREPLPPPSEINWELRDTLRQDDALIKQFVNTECRLLEDMGVDPKAVNRIRLNLDISLRQVLQDATLQSRESVDSQLGSLVESLQNELHVLATKAEHRELIRHLQGVLVALAGGMIVTSNALIGAGAVPVTAGLSIPGAALSAAVGQDLVTRGIDIARG